MLIDYQNVSIYQADKCILKDINFHIDEGEFAYLIGKVGSGKSSLLKTLYCELDLVEGETEKAEILGRDLKTIKRKEIPALRKELGIIFQDFQLLHDRTVRKNFEFVLKATKWKGKKENGKISINGWKEDSSEDLLPFLKKYIDKGVRYVLCTEISKDGTLQGPAIDLYKKVMETYPQLHLIASGGVSCNEDIQALEAAGIPAVVFGKAFYEGKINIEKLVVSD